MATVLPFSVPEHSSAAAGLTGVSQWAVEVMEGIGAPGAGLIVALENLFPPLPSEIILPLAGFTASRGSFSLVELVETPRAWWEWIWLWLMFPLFFICILAETNRSPFDLPETENELVAGFQTEYGGLKFSLFMIAEYMNMILISALTVLMFFGGWQAPIDSPLTNAIPTFFWFFLKTFLVVSMFLWIRATFPRYRYDQIMRLGWKIFIPLTIVWIVVVGVWMQTPWSLWK